MPSLCRDCLTETDDDTADRCPACGGGRMLAHPELWSLAIAHVDCDAFYASIEKRDNPALADLPVIVGGGARGVVATACYVARRFGVRSAMPMFKALKLCPHAVVVPPRHAVYAAVSREIRAMLEALTPAVEPLALDEAFLDLSGTARLHGAPPARLLAALARRIEAELGLGVSVGLSHNKFLAKIASDLDKPRGFSVIGRAETAAFLAGRPVGIIWGVGPASAAALERSGLCTLDDVRAAGRARLERDHGPLGLRLWDLAHGRDDRRVISDAPLRSISHETTFAADTADPAVLEGHLWRLAEMVADRAKARGLAGRIVVLKLKRADHSILTRRETLDRPTQIADRIDRVIRRLLAAAMAGPGGAGPFRLAGVGLSGLETAHGGDEFAGDLFDAEAPRRAAAERAADAIRARFGKGAIIRGRALR
jgi:DNA polymerase-4